MRDDYLKRILTASVYDVARETPLDSAPNLSARLNRDVLLKREDLQDVFSFKLRGSYNKIAHLTDEERSGGVIAASAGNHAQGVALAANAFGCSATIVMPTTVPKIKVDAVRARGANVELYGDSFDEANTYAQQKAAAEGRAYIPPYDDADVIAGQGTIGVEILRQHQAPIEAVFVPVGGGGLIAGISVYIKSIRPDIKVIGVEPRDAASMKAALAAGRPVELEHVGIFADGAAVKQVGTEAFAVCSECVDDVITVDTDAICAAIKDVFEDTRSILEPAGALSIAGLKQYADGAAGNDGALIAVASGANMNFDRLRHVAERAELGENREAILAVTIPEKPGSFRAFCSALGKRNITEFNYRYADTSAANVFVGIEISDKSEKQAIKESLGGIGLDVLDLSDNECAKLHVRHMVGGRAIEVSDEKILRFVFPERPGALTNFLDHMQPSWNISLFHYRNHGTDVGRVLVGIQVPEQDESPFQAFLNDLHYPYHDETENAACRLFL
jgi:threonine dehydratase